MAEQKRPAGPDEALRAALGEALREEKKARQAESALGALRREVASLAAAEFPGTALIEALARRLGAPRAALWRLGADSFEPAGVLAIPTLGLGFPAPHPFGQALLPPRGWLPADGLPPGLRGLTARGDRLFFLPLERELLLQGFAILAFPAGLGPEAGAFEELAPLLALGARLLHHQWALEDVSARRQVLAAEVSEQRRHAQALERTNWGVTQGDRVRTEFLRFASRSLNQGLGELLVLLKLGTDGAYAEEEAGAAFTTALRIARHLRSLLAEVERCTETADRTVGLEPLDAGPVLRGAKDAFERQGGAGLTWPNLATPLPKVLADKAILQEVFATLLGLQAFHARSAHEALRIEIDALTLRLRFPFPDLDLAPVVAALDGARADGLDSGGTGGPALALVVSRQLLRDLGGDLKIESEGRGSLVCVDLALAQP